MLESLALYYIGCLIGTLVVVVIMSVF